MSRARELAKLARDSVFTVDSSDNIGINSTSPTRKLDVSGNVNFQNEVSVGGTLTYEDVTNIDAVGVITAREGIHAGAGVSVVGVGTFTGLDISGDIDVDGHTDLDNVSISGVVTATTFVGDGNKITGIVTHLVGGDNISVSATNGQVTITGAANTSNILADTLIVSGVSTVGVVTGMSSLGVTDIFASGNVGISSELDVSGTVKVGTGVTLFTTGAAHLSGGKVRSLTDGGLLINTTGDTAADANIALANDGSAEFVGDPGTNGTVVGTKIVSTGLIRVARSTDGPVFQGNKTDGSGYNITLNADGSSVFAGTMQVAAFTDGSTTKTMTQVLAGGGGGGGGSSDKISEGNTEAEVVDTGSDGHFKVTTEGTERMRILSDGRVIMGGGSTVYGNANADDLVVGTTASGHRGGITIAAASNQDARLAFSKGTSFFDSLAGYIVYQFSDNRMATYVNMSERFAIDSNGKILIGHNGLTARMSAAALEIYKGNASNDIAIINSTADDSDGARSGNLIFSGRQSGGERTTLASIGSHHEGSADDEKGVLMFRTNDGSDGDSPTERLRITSTGRIEQKSNNEDIDMDATASGQLKLDGNGYNAALALNAQGLNIYNNSGNRGIIFGTNETERLRITSDGDVSITNGAFGGSGTAPKLNVVGSSGVMITHNNSTDRPTVGHSGNEPNITTFSNHFYNEVHRCITDFRSVCEGTHAGYILLVPAHPGSGNVSGKKFYGTIMCDRGSTGTGNSTQVAKIHASTAYSNSKFFVEIDRHSQYICGASKVTYSGTDYLAVRFNLGGGGPAYRTYIDGKHRGTDANFLRVVRENEVTVVDKHFGSLTTNPSGPPTCGVFVRDMTGSTYDNGTLSSGTVVYQYAPSGQNSPYSTSDGTFTARVNGLYLVCGGVLVENGTGRLEGQLQWYDGSNWHAYVNFNGTGTTYDGPTFTCMIPLKEGYALRINRNSGNAYNPNHSQNYFGVHLLNGLMRDDVPI